VDGRSVSDIEHCLFFFDPHPLTVFPSPGFVIRQAQDISADWPPPSPLCCSTQSSVVFQGLPSFRFSGCKKFDDGLGFASHPLLM